MNRDEDQSGLSGRMRYLLSLLFIWWAFLIPFICQLLHLPPFLFAQAFKGCGQSLGVCGQICRCPRCAFDCLDASSDTLSPYFTATASLRQYIMWYLLTPRGCGPLEEVAIGGMALTERGDLLELWNQVSVFYWQLPLSVDCVIKKHRHADRPF